MEIIHRSFGTHDGSFHADEVTACSLLLLFNRIDRDKVHRTRDEAVLRRCDYVCDVGGEYEPKRRRFDHHQADYRGEMSSAGMVLLYLRDHGSIDPLFYDHLNLTLVKGVDAHDTGMAELQSGVTTFSQVISNFQPIKYDAAPKEMEAGFWQAVDFTVAYLDRLHKRHLYTLECKAIVQEKMRGGGYLMIFDEMIPWMDNFFELGGQVHPAQFVIMPAGEHWKLRGIPPNIAGADESAPFFAGELGRPARQGLAKGVGHCGGCFLPQGAIYLDLENQG